ncbi:hypothetical protein Kisp01_47960 [Kineosporia sp. NBRC 101677]|uniref:hypothetical protein n=1 Tax=Kineosporia sp. NBRC 101677 TaxID=3032197 RepID=UPI0024A4F032|nr:hypothetical protein [Kineosporia sp. NBRC 101677]GLY17782.1 hypothetical protein Kisp01_47960 [Kineosporia sp. NBRC 101677]
MSDYYLPADGPGAGNSGTPYPRRRDRRQAQQYSPQPAEDTYEAAPEESFRNQTFSADFHESGVDLDEFSGPEQPGYDYDESEQYDDYQGYGGYDQYGEYAGPYERSASNPQFEQVYHQPYNQPHEPPGRDTLELDDAEPGYAGPEQEYDEGDDYEDDAPYEAPHLQDEERAAYQADFQRTLARTRYEDEEAPAAPPVEEPRTPVTKTGMSAAPASFPLPIIARGGVPSQRSPASSIGSSGPQAHSTGAPRLAAPNRPPVEKLPPRRQPQRRPSPAARGFVPSQDRIGTAREVMSYLARRPWLQLDVVDIILGTQFDRDDVAHALIVLQQTGRIRSHLRGDRVCYSYATAESLT